MGAAPRAGRRAQRSVHADPGRVRQGRCGAGGVPACHRRRGRGRGDVRERDDRRGQPEDGRAAGRPGTSGRPGGSEDLGRVPSGVGGHVSVVELTDEQMKEMGLFGLTVPDEFGGAGMDLMSYALVVSELSRGWMSLSGVLNTHFMGVYLLTRHGTDEQKERWLPRMATGELRAALSMSEPGAGSDVQAIRCRAIRDGDEYVVTGQKMWVTNGLRAGLVVLLCKTD